MKFNLSLGAVMMVSGILLSTVPDALCADSAKVQATIVNSGFEEPLRADGTITGWNGAIAPGIAVSLDTAEPHSGAASLLLQRVGEGNGQEFYSMKPFVAGAEYSAAQDEEWKLTYWVRVQGGAKFDCLLRHFPATLPDSYGGPVNWWTLGGKSAAEKTAWVKREVTVDIPRGTGFMYLLMRFVGPPGAKVWLDDFSLEKVRSLPEIQKPDPPRQLKRLIYLNHPFAMEFGYHIDPETAIKTGVGEFTPAQVLEMERQVSKRWAEEIKKLGPDDGLVINGLGMAQIMMMDGVMAPVWKAAREHMPGRYVVTFSNPGPVEELGKIIQKKFLDNGYTFDPSTLVAEAWGQSTEGCVPNYAAHIAAGIGLPKGFPMRYDLTFPDATFAMTGKFLERIPIGETDVSAYLFEGKDGRYFAIYFPGVVRDQDTLRHARIAGTFGQLEFTRKNGAPLQPIYRDDGFLVPLFVDSTGEPYYVWAKGPAREEFRAMIAGARIQ